MYLSIITFCDEHTTNNTSSDRACSSINPSVGSLKYLCSLSLKAFRLKSLIV